MEKGPFPHSQGNITPGTSPLGAQGSVESPLFLRMQIPPTYSPSFIVEENDDQRRSMMEKVGMFCPLTPQHQQPTLQFSLPWRPTRLINPRRNNRPIEESLALLHTEDTGVIVSVATSPSRTERRPLLIIEGLQTNGNDNSAYSAAEALSSSTTSPPGDGHRRQQGVHFHPIALPSKIYMPDIF